MFEWKSPDPRLVELVWRIREAARGRFRVASGSPESRAVIDEQIALDRELKDQVRARTSLGTDPPDQDPDD
jgi:hypothetical protein